MIRWFGVSWNAPVNIERAHVATPVGTICVECETPFQIDDQGVGLPFYGSPNGSTEAYYHRRCLANCLGIAPEDPAP